MLKWFPAYQTSPVTVQLQTGGFGGLAYDGANLWVTNPATCSVIKIRPSDGTVLETNLGFGCPTSPTGVAFDGTRVWVTDVSDGYVIPLTANTGQSPALVSPGGVPRAIAFDGTHIIVAIPNIDQIGVIQASSGRLLSRLNVPSGVSTSVSALAFDGANLWIATAGNAVAKLSDNGAVGTNFQTFTVGNGPASLAFDGNNIWVANAGDNTVTKLRASDGAQLGTFTVGSRPSALAFDGANIWVANLNSNNVTELRASDGTVLGTFAVGQSPSAMAFDGVNIWTANSGDGTLTKP